MKKISLLVLTIVLLIPITVFAAVTPRVLTVDAKADSSTINYTGTTEDGVYAVMCKLYDSSDNEMDLLSSQVDNKEFKGSFSNVAAGTYKVSCARYEGGEVVSDDVPIEGELTTANPKTGDSILVYVLALVVAVLGTVGGTLYIRKTKKLKTK